MTVHFIGAGPGAADLMTIRGRDLIAAAPVCLYAGSLVPPEVLKLALPTRFHGFIDWFHERGSSRTLETVVIDALDAFQLPAGVLGYAEVLTYGARKYAPRNWEKGLKFSNVYDSAIRHALKMQYEAIDAIADGGSGLPHRSHYAWNVIACYVFTLRGRTDLDDRPALELK